MVTFSKFSKPPLYKIQIVILPFTGGKRQKGSKTITLYDIKPFDMEKVEKNILKGLEIGEF